FPFVGRSDELIAMRAALDRAQSGEGGLVWLGAEAGGGKTRLIREFAQEAATRGVLVLYGASDAAVSTPYQPLREWLEFLVRVSEPDALRECLPAAAEPLTQLAPELASLTGTPALGPDRADTEGDRFTLQAAVGEFLRRLSQRMPLLLV